MLLNTLIRHEDRLIYTIVSCNLNQVFQAASLASVQSTWESVIGAARSRYMERGTGKGQWDGLCDIMLCRGTMITKIEKCLVTAIILPRLYDILIII